MFLRKSSQLKNEVSIDEPLNTDWDGNELLLCDVLGSEPDIVNRDIETEHEHNQLLKSVSKLNDREKIIMEMRFGLNGRKEKTQREVADKMAVYATGEKSKLLRFVQVLSIIGTGLTVVAIVLQTLAYEPDLRRSGAIFATFIGFIVMSIITLYVTGLLQRFSKHRKAVKAVKIITIVLMAIVTHYVLAAVVMFTVVYAMFTSAKIEVSTDASEFNKYIHNGEDKDSEYRMGTNPLFDVMPEKIEADVTEYQLTYYNPWDGQYVVYMTLDYGDKYDAEIARLQAIGIDDYKGIYTVTGEPEGYDLVAMDSDDYNGFVYAMIPEGQEGNTKITYCALVFCNYFLDLDVHKYMPDKYLLPGFDATDDNPYRKQMMDK